MAVSVEDQSSSPLTHPIKDKNCQDPVTSNCEIMKTARKERRKPELQLYRPGRGLHNKHAKTEENSKVTTNGLNVPSCHENNINSSTKTDFKSREKSGSNEKYKNNRNRRPDIQVYTPKAKVAAQINGKAITSMNDCSSKWAEDENEEFWKKSGSHCDRHYSSEVKSNKTQNTKREMNGYVNDKNLVLNQLDDPQPTNSWADYPEESDLSNSRSSPENKLCNGYSEDNLLQQSNSAVTDLKNKKSIKEDHRRPRNKKGHKRNDNLVSTSKEVVTEKNCRDPELGKKNKFDVDPTFQKRNEESGRRNNRNTNGSGNFPAENKNEKKFNTNSLDRGKMKHKESNFNNNERGFISEYNEHSATQNEIKSEKKKREKVDSTLPPRFQKQKVQSSSDINSSNQGRGILKIPIEPDPPVEIMDNLHISKGFPEPPPMFIHKHLFDPNNPNKPEVVNIPAPVPPPHMPYGKINQLFYNSDPMSLPYISAPVETGPYIPPPQPPITNSHYRFLQPDIRPKNIPNFVDIRESSTTLQCPIQPPLLNNVFPTPHGFNEMIPAEPVKKRYKPIVEKNLHEIVLLEREISSLLSKVLVDNNLNTLKQCRWKLQLRYENIILADPKYCAEKNPEQTLWKTVYHQIIETFRKRLEEEQQNSEEIKETLLNIILEGTMFYENLLEKQQETYGFKLAKLLEVEHINTSCLSDQIRCVLISVQKILIYLGDLARYKEQISQTTNYGKARSWYLKAQQIAPKNGKPYHQLALLAFNTKRKLDAVYYYMRSLAASNPFLSAKESLLSLFEEAKKKYEIYEKKRMRENASETDVLEKTTERCEVWIKNDGSSSKRPAELEKNIDSSELKKLSDVELNKRFVTSFLHVHGKLFTKIGMETFPDTLNNMLKEFYFLLQRTPIPLTSSRLLQLLAINIFSVTNSSLKENGREHGGRSLLQEQALYTSMTMMALLMDRCCLLHIAHKSLPEYSNQIIPDDFAQLLPSVKIWTDWMSCQKCLWAPPSSQLLERLNSRFHSDVWSSFADLLSALLEIDNSNTIIVSQHSANCEPIILEEDSTFAGFVPLLGSIQNPTYAVQPFDKDRAKHCSRISKIQFFGDYLCGITPPYLEFDIESKRFVSLVNNLSLEESHERSVLLSSDDLFREEHLCEEINDEIINKNSVSNEFQLLWSRKEALSKAREQQQKCQAQVQAVLQKHQSQRPIVLKIKPRYLVPDTNCFIDHLKLFKNILASTDFHLIIPLVVINELDGLARGTRVNEHISTEHANRVTVLSREAILFLEQQFASRHPHLRAITSKGSILDTISFRSEEMGQNKGTNDDLILNCCLHYCKDRAENFMPKNRDEPITLFREVVLLTDDRNLRVKALTHHVPVRDLLSFLQWANS